MDDTQNIAKFIIYADCYYDDGVLKFVHKNKQSYNFPEFDFYIPIFLLKSNHNFDYIQINKDSREYNLEPQSFNPFFIELSFFDNIQRSKVLSGVDLNNDIINFIRDSRIELSELTNQEIVFWFDQIGVNELPWFKGTQNEITADDLDKINFLQNNIISKANFFNIDINK